jgi:lipid-binding SYLF domain-containing protein
MELAFITSIATLIGFFAGIIITALIVSHNKKTDNDRYAQMIEHNQIVEMRLLKYANNSERIAEALEKLVELKS